VVVKALEEYRQALDGALTLLEELGAFQEFRELDNLRSLEALLVLRIRHVIDEIAMLNVFLRGLHSELQHRKGGNS